MRLLAWALGIIGVIVYGAYKADPQLAIISGIGMVMVVAVAILLKLRSERRVRQMVADVDSQTTTD